MPRGVAKKFFFKNGDGGQPPLPRKWSYNKADHIHAIFFKMMLVSSPNKCDDFLINLPDERKLKYISTFPSPG